MYVLRNDMASKDFNTLNSKHRRYAPYSKKKLAKTQESRNPPMPATKEELSAAANFTTLPQSQQGNILDEDGTTTEVYPCISARQPYAGFILDGLKTVETRWSPVFRELEGRTTAIHVAWRDWEGGDEWRTILQGDHTDEDIEEFVGRGERHGRAVVAGLVDVGETWQCPANAPTEETREWEKAALLRPLSEKFLTRLSNPRWLRRPVQVRGQRGIWEVTIPPDCLLMVPRATANLPLLNELDEKGEPFTPPT